MPKGNDSEWAERMADEVLSDVLAISQAIQIANTFDEAPKEVIGVRTRLAVLMIASGMFEGHTKMFDFLEEFTAVLQKHNHEVDVTVLKILIEDGRLSQKMDREAAH